MPLVTGFNSGSGPHRDNDVCFVCSFSPPINSPHAPFNRLLLFCVLTTSSPRPLSLFLKSLPVHYRPGLMFPLHLPFHGSGGEELLLVWIWTKVPAPAWRGVPVAAGWPQRKQSAAVPACSSSLSRKFKGKPDRTCRGQRFLSRLVVSTPYS